jgi:DNA processing protein
MSDALSPEARDLLALNLVPNLGPRLTAALLRHFGSAAAVRGASAAQLRQVPLIGPKLSEQFAAALADVPLDRECERIVQHGVRLIALGSAEYPPSLAQIPNPPHLLYVRGALTPADHRAVAIVGSRGCTGYGRRVAEGLASGLVRAGYCVVSGLARGIDGIAHAAALKAGGRTVAVLAGGLSRIYPPEHADLAAGVQAAGALVSEAPMDAEPLPAMFPPRNRIISGLSQAVVVVEASERSGTLITARHAAEQSREVFAVPGPVDSPASSGCHQLIRQGVTLARSVDDILEALATGLSPGAPPEPISRPEKPVVASRPPDLDGAGLRLWEFLADGPRHIDAMAQELALGVPELTRTLMVLEMMKAIRRLPGNQYERR